jgi:MoxR-like ATPase
MVLGGKVLALRDGRYNVAFEDLRRMAPAALRHRLILNFEGEAEGVGPDAIVADVLAHVPEPET